MTNASILRVGILFQFRTGEIEFLPSARGAAEVSPTRKGWVR